MDEGIEFQYEVAWFPPNGPDRTRTFTGPKAMEKAERFMEGAADMAPILSRREVIVGPWVVVSNPTADGLL